MLKKIKSTVKHHFNKNFGTLTMCKKCYAFYYKSVWHFEAPGFIQDEAKREIPLRLTECPACIEMEVTLQERDSDLMSYGVFN